MLIFIRIIDLTFQLVPSKYVKIPVFTTSSLCFRRPNDTMPGFGVDGLFPITPSVYSVPCVSARTAMTGGRARDNGEKCLLNDGLIAVMSAVNIYLAYINV